MRKEQMWFPNVEAAKSIENPRKEAIDIPLTTTPSTRLLDLGLEPTT